MSILAALARAYELLPDAPPYGYSAEKVGFLISLNGDGSVAHVIDLREGEGRKKVAPQMVVPQGAKRASGIAPNFLWDKTAYVLGVTAGDCRRTADENAAFVKRHLDALADNSDPGLAALAAFLARWTPEQFVAPVWPDDMRDQNVAFAYEPDRRTMRTLQDRPAARSLWQRLAAEGDRSAAICLIIGEMGPVARLHPAVKGVWGAQSSGASIVSFNLDAFTSYGHEQGDNAPISEVSAFAYTTTLNRFLERDSGHRIQIGDTSTVFWADASDATLSSEAEGIFAAAVGFLHRDRPGRPSLALDLMEELRPVLAGRLALSLINRRQMRAADFETSENGAVMMSEDARKTVLTAWQERKREERHHVFLDEKAPLGLVPFLQAQMLARHLRGDLDAYPPWFWK